MLHTILGYDFTCKEFQFQGRRVQGLVYEVKTNEKISLKNRQNISVELSKEKGFVIHLHQLASGIYVMPHKSYVLVPCRDAPWESEGIEISHKALMKHSDCFEEGISGFASSEYQSE